MISGKNICVVGGDVRQVYLANELILHENEVTLYGFDECAAVSSLKVFKNPEDAVCGAEYVILPIPVSRDSKTLNAPLFSKPVFLNNDFFEIIKNKKIFAGIVSSMPEDVKAPGLCIKDYAAREDFMVHNAVPTAEGAVKIAMQELGETINSSCCLVAGYGRVGKVLCRLLKNMGAQVTVSSGNFLAKSEGFNVIDVSRLDQNIKFDVIFNTVPHVIFKSDNLKFLKGSNVIIDLASAPGGVEKEEARKAKIKVIATPGIPGKFFPKTAAKIIADCISDIIEEENL